ncbi:unnamed protein product [Paramecium primaurelia]|uniref:Uncharacterized protein n=1 Tax=Paramecium primaurelia TaxID=5886 RepID=A0A8S1LSQ3_PARPR|nr:unnamed protein product [Paramecium primaurelia]
MNLLIFYYLFDNSNSLPDIEYLSLLLINYKNQNLQVVFQVELQDIDKQSYTILNLDEKAKKIKYSFRKQHKRKEKDQKDQNLLTDRLYYQNVDLIITKYQSASKIKFR